jgi:hypothetical protein
VIQYAQLQARPLVQLQPIDWLLGLHQAQKVKRAVECPFVGNCSDHDYGSAPVFNGADAKAFRTETR